MASKKKQGSAKEPLAVQKKDGESEGEALAHFVLRPSVQGAVTIRAFSKHLGELDLAGVIQELADQSKAVNDGELKRIEAILTAQAHTLDMIFNKLAIKAATSEYLNHFETNMRLALKAQSQCRATLEALAEITNPRPMAAFVKQANIAHGPQQVNNALTVNEPAASPGCTEIVKSNQIKDSVVVPD